MEVEAEVFGRWGAGKQQQQQQQEEKEMKVDVHKVCLVMVVLLVGWHTAAVARNWVRRCRRNARRRNIERPNYVKLVANYVNHAACVTVCTYEV